MLRKYVTATINLHSGEIKFSELETSIPRDPVFMWDEYDGFVLDCGTLADWEGGNFNKSYFSGLVKELATKCLTDLRGLLSLGGFQ